jgi:hypothetical protein
MPHAKRAFANGLNAANKAFTNEPLTEESNELPYQIRFQWTIYSTAWHDSNGQFGEWDQKPRLGRLLLIQQFTECSLVELCNPKFARFLEL